MTNPKPSAGHSLHREIEAARVLLATYPDVYGEDRQARTDGIEGETNLHEAIGQGLKRILEIELLEPGIEAAIANLKARAARLDAQKKNLRTAMCVAMEMAELPGGKLETPVGTISLKRIPPKLDIVDESAIPARFFKPQDPKLDKAALTAALKEKEIIPGAQLDNGSITIQVGSR